MAPRDTVNTAFRTPIGNFYYTMMPFGLKNVGAMYQRAMTAIFHNMMHRELEDYVDDIVIKSKTRESHARTLKKVFERCRHYKLCMNPLKCAFGVTTRKFLVFLVHQKGIDVDPLKVKAIVTMKPLTSVKELKSFIGKLSYIRRFILRLAAAIAPFTPLLKKGVKFQWSNEHQLAFRKLQEMITNLPTVRSPMPSMPLRLYLASNDKAVGTLITQEVENGIEQLIYYVSRALRNTKTRYPSVERTSLSLIYATQKLQHYLLAYTVHLMTKSNPIRTLLQRPVLLGRLAQWLLQLSEYDMVSFMPRAVKGQAIANLLAQFPREDISQITDEMLGEVAEVACLEENKCLWEMTFDGSSISIGGGARIVLVNRGKRGYIHVFQVRLSLL